MLPVLQIKETCIYTEHLARAVAFYQDVLQLPLVGYEQGRHAFFHAGSSMLLIFNPKDSRSKTTPPPHHGSGALHLAFEVARANYEAAKAKLEQQGVAIEDEIVWPSGSRSFYFRDPDGHCLECIEPGVWPDAPKT